LWENPKGRDHIRDVGVGGRIILKRTLTALNYIDKEDAAMACYYK
jgi:hypothetical protein